MRRKHKMKKLLKKNKGITLVALVVTIVILLILAGISINMVLGENGIVAKAQEAKRSTNVGQTDELINLSIMTAQTEDLGLLTDKTLKKSLSDTLGSAGKDYTISGDEENGWTIGVDGKTYIVNPEGKHYEKVVGNPAEWEVTGNAVTKYLGTSNDIVIPNYVGDTKITEIGTKLFYGSDKTGTLKISEGIETIGENAFAGSNLTGDLEIPGSVKEIKDNAFVGGTKFKGGKLILNEGLETIGKTAFLGAKFIGELKLPSTLKTIDSFAFLNCTGFTGKLIIPGSVLTIGDSAFSGCSGFETLILKEGVKNIEAAAFGNCNFKNDLIIPEGITFGRANSAFPELKGESLYLGSNVKGFYLDNPSSSVKRFVMKSLPINPTVTMKSLPQLKLCWVSKDVINGITNLGIQQSGVAASNLQIYTDAAANDPNWPSDFPKDSLPNGITIHYNTSEEDFMKISY